MTWAVAPSCCCSLQGSGVPAVPGKAAAPDEAQGKLCTTALGAAGSCPLGCSGGCERSPSVITQLQFLGLLPSCPSSSPSQSAAIAVGAAAGSGASALAPSKHNKSLDHQPQKSLLIKGFRDGCSKSRRDPVEAGQCKHLGKRLSFQMSSPHKTPSHQSRAAVKAVHWPFCCSNSREMEKFLHS